MVEPEKVSTVEHKRTDNIIKGPIIYSNQDK